MKKLAFLCLLGFSFAGMSAPILGFNDARYLGLGDWRDDAGNGGSYETYIEFSSNNTRADYAWSDGATTIMLSFAFDPYGNFLVSQDGNVVGSGFCMSVQCEYSIVLNNLPVSEVFTFMDNQLFKLGTGVNANGVTVYWEEDLQLLPVR